MKKFLIDHIDPFGQGVFKEDENIFFIPKTLPNESGTFKITQKKKGVHFGQLLSLESKSPQRKKPECPHFEHCNGCQYLHTSYSDELIYKTNAFERLLKPFGIDAQEIQVIDSPNRLHYRNRIQLHYDLTKNKIGFKTRGGKDILQVPDCKIYLPNLESSILEVTKNWKSLIKKEKQPKKGHVEIYQRDEGIHISWNKPYANEGFTQVNEEVNNKMLNEIASQLSPKNANILDLFGGNGNLVRNVKKQSSISVDIYRDQKRNDQFFHLDLFKEDALNEFDNHIKNNFDILVLDPPRSGFSNLESWVNSKKPDTIVYVSCHPATMTRDIKKLPENYSITSVYLVDLFPSTHHFEALIILEKG